MDQIVEANLVPGRECGTCDVCCVALTIRDPELQKVQGVRCHHLQAGGGCDIYTARPTTCREYYCGWRMLRWVKAPLRPDVSGVLVRLHRIVDRASGEPSQAVIFSFNRPQALEAEGLDESLAAAVNAGLTVYMEIPGKPGFSSSRAKINDVLMEAVTLRDRAGMRAILRKAYAMGRGGKRERIVLDEVSPPPEASAPP